MKLNWNVSSMDTLLQITLKNDYSEAFQFHKALVYLINSDIPWKIFFWKKMFFPTDSLTKISEKYWKRQYFFVLPKHNEAT